MARRLRQGKLYQFFTNKHDHELSITVSANWTRPLMVAGIALAMFIALFGWGGRYFGWSDPSGKVQLALFTAFILGIVASYKSRG